MEQKQHTIKQDGTEEGGGTGAQGQTPNHHTFLYIVQYCLVIPKQLVRQGEEKAAGGGDGDEGSKSDGEIQMH